MSQNRTSELEQKSRKEGTDKALHRISPKLKNTRITVEMCL